MDAVTIDTDTDTDTGIDEAERTDTGDATLLEDDLLVEEVSIDGMCGVY